MTSDAGNVTLGIGLGFISVGLGILSLICRSECEEVSIGYGCIYCKKKPAKRKIPPAAIVEHTEV
jgi:hypothetical protein